MAYGGHSFGKKTFHKPTYCHHCSDLLWGLIGQGYICEGEHAMKFHKSDKSVRQKVDSIFSLPLFNLESKFEEEKLNTVEKLKISLPSLSHTASISIAHFDEEGNVLSFPLNLIHPNFFFHT